MTLQIKYENLFKYHYFYYSLIKIFLFKNLKKVHLTHIILSFITFERMVHIY